MKNATQGSERRSSSNRRGRNNNRSRNRNQRGRSGRNRSSNYTPKKKQNPILAFFSKLFGTASKSQKSSPRRQRTARNRDERDPKTNEPQPEVCSPRLYVGNLSYDTTESDLFDHFATIGQVKNAEVVRDRNDRSKGFGFVEMNSVEMAQTASEKFHRTDYMGRQIIVAGARK